jgi:hypothetical protein
LSILIESYEKFLSIYLKNYTDAPNATKFTLHEIDRQKNQFSILPEGEKQNLSISYLGILKIWHIQKTCPSLDSKEKFRIYIDYMENTADVIGAIEVEVAKYVFVDRSTIVNEEFNTFIKIMQNNFNKKKNSKEYETIVKNCLNAARDIMYYRVIALSSNTILDGKRQDPWLVTADTGLINLAKVIYFIPDDESDAKYFKYFRNKEQLSSTYWKYCDNLADDKITSRTRNEIQSSNIQRDMSNLLRQIKILENEIEKICEPN